MKPSERRRLQNLAEWRRAEEGRLQKLLEEEDEEEQPGQQQVVLNETPCQATSTEAVFSPSSKSVRFNHDASSLPSRQKANPLPSPSSLSSSSSSTKKRTRLSESPRPSSGGRKTSEPKWLDTQNPPPPKKSTAKTRGRLTVSLDLSSDDEDEEPPLLAESKTFKRHWKRTNGTRNPSAPLSRPPPVSQQDSDSEDSFTRNMDTFSRKKNKTSSLSSSMKVMSLPEASSTFKTNKSRHRAKPRGTSLSSDDDNDDTIEHITSNQEDGVENSSDEDQESACAGSHGRKSHATAKRCTASTKRRRSLSSSSSSSENDGEQSARVAHNPIALERLEKETIKAALLANTGAHPAASDQPQHDDLWEDPPEADGSEEEKKTSTKKSKQSKRPSSRRSSGSSFPSQSNRTTVGGTSAWYSNVLDIRGHWLQECDHDEDKLANVLHPDGRGRVADDSNQVNDPLVLVNGDERYKVPASLTRYFFDYQRTGIEFMFDCLIHNRGCILGDDMGLGKTIQTLGLLSALFRKSGTGLDILQMAYRQKLVKVAMESRQEEERRALELGQIDQSARTTPLDKKRMAQLGLPTRWWPVLIVVPSSVVDNWKREIEKWTNLSVAVFQGAANLERATAQITSGMADILLTTKSNFVNDGFKELMSIPVVWKLVVFDEFHTFKNPKSKAVKNIRVFKSKNQNLVLGLSGTIMQNKHQELWTLVDLAETGILGEWKDFEREFVHPIKMGRVKSANQHLIDISIAKSNALTTKLNTILIERTKEKELSDFLPLKEEKVVMCELTDMQKIVYKQILTLPEINFVKMGSNPCDCGINKSFFRHFNSLKTRSEQVAYVRENGENIIKRKDCCYDLPYNPNHVQGGNEPLIHPDAVIWRSMKHHVHDEPCGFCPYCCGFPILSKLYKLGDHLALLQANKQKYADVEGHSENIDFQKELAFAKVALGVVVDKLPGGYTLRDRIMDDHVLLSGKLRVLGKLLDRFWAEDARVLVFSYSTLTLDLIRNYLMATGRKCQQMDGRTPTSSRQGLADEFNHDPSYFVFLLSTRAMGVGLNLVGASKVVIFDVEWNPSNDEQAQDRAFRIGQSQNVEVCRLVSQGTIDEMKYLRQLYKVQLKQDTFADESNETAAAPRIFRGVEGDRSRKGELFGYENLFRFKDGSFLDEIWKAAGQKISDQPKGGLIMHDATKISDALVDLSDDKLEAILNSDVGAVDRGDGNDEYELSWIADDSTKSVPGDDDRKPPARKCERIGANEETDQGTVHAEEYAEKNDEVVGVFDHGDLFRQDRGGAALEEGDEGYDEEMGGGTQNVFEIFERGVNLGDENPQDGFVDDPGRRSDGDQSTQNENPVNNEYDRVDESIADETAERKDIPPRPRPVQIPPLAIQPFGNTSKWTFEEPDWIIRSGSEEEEGDVDNGETLESNIKSELKPRAREECLDSKKSPSPPQLSTHVSNVCVEKQREEGQDTGGISLPKVNLFGEVSTKLKGGATDFKSSDLCVPTYTKKKPRQRKGT